MSGPAFKAVNIKTLEPVNLDDVEIMVCARLCDYVHNPVDLPEKAVCHKCSEEIFATSTARLMQANGKKLVCVNCVGISL